MILRKQIDLDHFDRDLFGGSSDCKGRYRSLYGISAIRNLQPLSQSKSRAPQGLNTEPTSQKRKNIIFKKMSQTNQKNKKNERTIKLRKASKQVIMTDLKYRSNIELRNYKF